MGVLNFESVLEAVGAFTPEQRRKLREALDSGPGAPSDREKAEELDRRLLAEGLISSIPPPITDPTPYREWKPIPIEGKPLSQTIIEERR